MCIAKSKSRIGPLLAFFSISLMSCTDGPTHESSSSAISLPDCDRYPCIQNEPEKGATHKIGDVYLRIPETFLQQPVKTIKVIQSTGGLGLSFCWPDLYGDLANCAPVTDRIKFHMRARREGPSPGWPERNRGQFLRIASRLEGPFDVGKTIVDEYRYARHGLNHKYVFVQNDDETKYVIADCSTPSCRVFGHDVRGINFQYRFGDKHVEDWPEMHEDIRSILGSFIVEELN